MTRTRSCFTRGKNKEKNKKKLFDKKLQLFLTRKNKLFGKETKVFDKKLFDKNSVSMRNSTGYIPHKPFRSTRFCWSEVN